MVNDKCIVIPAAGASERLGRPKQLVELEGKTLIRRAVETALEVLPNVIVVVGCEAPSVRNEIAGLPVMVVKNPDWKKGMGKSTAVGVRAAIDEFPGLDAVIIHLCDMPTIDGSHLRKLIAQHSDSSGEIVYTKYKDTEGVPALFGSKFFEDLLLLDGDIGAKPLIKRSKPSQTTFVRFPGDYFDLDYPEDLLLLEPGSF